MIPCDVVYYRPGTLMEAYEAYRLLQIEGKKPLYYAGGSEIITMSRAGSIRPSAIVDIKRIPECMLLSANDEGLHIGSACTLNQIKESRLFPLLGSSCGRIADHTNQCRITLGGNLCGTIIYRETSLPLLLSDARVSLFGSQGMRTVPFQSVFHGRMRLKPSEVVVQIHVPGWALKAPFFHVKHTTNEKIDYPLVSAAALWKDGNMRIAFSGLCSYPFRSSKIEAVLNDWSMPVSARVDKAAELLPEEPYSDVEGSGEYRLFVLKNMLHALLEDYTNGKI